MIITLLIVLLIICGIICIKNGDNFYNLDVIGIVSFIFTIPLMIIIIIIMTYTHVSANITVDKNNIQYESLCDRLELIQSEYEDISELNIMKDISEWNSSVIEYKYWENNIWTNWFFSKKVADNLKIINYKSYELNEK